MSKKLNEMAVMASLNTGSFGNVLQNREETEKLCKQHNVAKGEVTVKNLVFKKSDLENVNKVISKARTGVFYRYTRPLDWAGNAILPISNRDDLKREIENLKAELANEVEVLCGLLPEIKERRKAEQNSLFDENRFPTVAKIKSAYRIQLNIRNIPDEKSILDDTNIDEETRQDMLESVKFSGQVIFRNLLFGEGKKGREDNEANPKSLYGILKKFTRIMSQEDPRFKQATVDLLKEFGETIRSFNVYLDSDLDKIAEEVDERFGDLQSDLLRENEEVRDSAIEKAQEMIDLLEGYDL
ncbi:MAG: hypothetical protein ACFFCZ_20160 [Promethearchaeota archaeon]